MTDSSTPEPTPATTGGDTALPFGTFRYSRDDDRLSWSEGLFSIFGFADGEVVPTLALMSAHQYADDRPAWHQAVQLVLADGGTISRWHRIVDARTRIRTVHTSIQAERDVKHRIVGLQGIVTDLTDRLRLDRQEELRLAVNRSAETRAAIEQAKGVLMATLDLTESQAFDLLRWHSSYGNIKLRHLSRMLIDRLADTVSDGTEPRQRLRAILSAIAGPREPVLPTEHTAEPIAPPAPVDQYADASTRIPVSLLPRTLVRAIAAAAQSITIADCLTADWPLVYVNAAFEKLTGYRAKDILGRNCRFLQGRDTGTTQAKDIHGALIDGREIRTVLRNYRRDGTAFWNEVHLSAVRDATGRLTHYIGYQADVSERIEREQQLEHLAYHDAATSLPNHAAALRHLTTTIADSDDDTEFTVLHIRLSGFRTPETADTADSVRAVLTAAAQRLIKALAAPSFLAKLDEDAYLAVIPADGHPDPRAAATAAFDEPITTGVGQVLVSVGHARYPVDARDAQELIDRSRGASGDSELS